MTRKVGPCGGTGGRARDMDVSEGTHIVKIIVRHGAAIDAITVFYQHDGGIVESTDQWGSDGGHVTEINFLPHEHITAVSGHFGERHDATVVRSLKFMTNVGTHGPYGEEDGESFELVGEVVGFHGRSGGLLDSIGVYVKCT